MVRFMSQCMRDAVGGCRCCMRHVKCVCAGRCRAERLLQSCCCCCITAVTVIRPSVALPLSQGWDRRCRKETNLCVVFLCWCCVYGCSMVSCLLTITVYISKVCFTTLCQCHKNAVMQGAASNAVVLHEASVLFSYWPKWFYSTEYQELS